MPAGCSLCPAPALGPDSLSGPSPAAEGTASTGGVTVLFRLQVLDDFSKQVDSIHWPVGSSAASHYTALDGYLSTYQVGAQTVGTSRPC